MKPWRSRRSGNRPVTTGQFQITTATDADYDVLLTMNRAAVPAVNLIDRAVLERLHGQAEVMLVARAGATQTPVGFLLALNRDADYSSPNFLYFRGRYARFAYVDRVVVDAAWRGHGIGVRLYKDLIARSASLDRITCEVNLEPPNPRSLAFHSRLGFVQVGEQDTEGGAKRVALLALELAAAPFPDRDGHIR